MSEEIELIVFWSICRFTNKPTYSCHEIHMMEWLQESEDYHVVTTIKVPVADPNDVLQVQMSVIDKEIAEHRLAIIKAEEKKASLLALEHIA